MDLGHIFSMRRISYHTMRAAALLAMGLLVVINLQSATYTWDGGGSNNNLSTAGNWNPDGAPAQGAGADLIFAGSTRLSPAVEWGWTVKSLSFNSTAGAFTLTGGQFTIGTGGVTNNSTRTQTIQSQIALSANQTWNAAAGAIVSTDNFNGGNNTLTLAGSSAITISGQVSSVATLNLTGSGSRTFGTQTTASTVNITGTGASSFNGQLNVGTLNMSAGTNNFANVQATGGINISGSANANFTGPVTGGSSGMNISSSGNVNFNGSINSGSITLNGSGTTTISGNGSMSTGAVTVNNGTLVLDHNGAAINSTLTVNNGGTVIFGQNNQIPNWQTVTLNEGSTLHLGNTSQTIANLIITGDSVIDFGEGGSQLNVQEWGNISIADGITITIVNWDDSKGDVFAGRNPGTPVVNIQYADNNGNVYATGTWGGGLITPGAPVPEPATYGFIMLGSGIAFFAWRRWQTARKQAQAQHV
ncbi:PEP-CTERM sorting domain-containing protein [Opitutaceae bacterium TAV4]|nr:PEP-CTERM sorting domain-containing protein [Opitutaceae bacterium TAV4]RRK01540.1 PEP-CTERM sorting domain-containing protein [Opitutaceae bacterium TAV3]